MWVSFARRHVVSLGILSAAVGLGGYLYFVDSGRVTTSEADARKRNLFRAFRRSEISELVIEDKGQTIRITRRADDAGDAMYYLDGSELADQTAVDKTLSVIEFATAERRLDDTADKHAMGLDAPQTRLTLAMGSLTLRLSIGGPAPAPPGAAYAEVEGEGVAVVSRDLVTELTRPRDAYRGKTLVPYLSSNLAELDLEGAPTDARRFVRGTWGGWAITLSSGQKVRVDRDAFDRVLTSLADLRAESFTEEADAERALSSASEKVHLTMVPRDAALARAVLDVGGECPAHSEDIVAMRVEPAPKKAACVPKGLLEPLSTPGPRLVDMHLFSLRPDEMEEITLSSDGKQLQLARAGTGWHLRAPTEGAVEHDVGQSFARMLHELVAEAVVSDKSPEGVGLEPPRTIARITRAGAGEDSPVDGVELGSERGDGFVYARRLADDAILRLTHDAARELVPSGFVLKSRKIIDEPAAQAARISIEGPAIHEVLRRSPTGTWTLEEPKSLAVDPGLATDVAEALAGLRAERWVADTDDGSFGLAAPRSTYQIELEGGVVRVETGRATSGGLFARRTDRQGVFVLSRATEQAIETWAVDRSYFMVDPESVRSIRIDRDGDHFTLAPARIGARDAGVSDERFEIARRALSEARAEGLVHVGRPRKEEGFDRPLMTLSVEGPSSPIISIGRGDVFRDTNVFYVRRDGIDATFAVAQSKLRPLVDLR